jgi:hypothetical protein
MSEERWMTGKEAKIATGKKLTAEEEGKVTWGMIISSNKALVVLWGTCLLLCFFVFVQGEWSHRRDLMMEAREERLAACSAYGPETGLPLNVPASEKKGDCVYVPLVEADCEPYGSETGFPLNLEASVKVGDCVYESVDRGGEEILLRTTS